MSKEDKVYRQTPDLNDKVHVLVCVVPANTLSQIRDSTMQKIQEIRAVASRLGEKTNLDTLITHICIYSLRGTEAATMFK